MKANSAKEKYFNALTQLEVEVQNQYLNSQITDLYYNNYLEDNPKPQGQSEEYKEYLKKLSSAFKREIKAEVINERHPLNILKILNREINKIEGDFQVGRNDALMKISSQTVPQKNIDFFNLMADIQMSYIKDTSDFIQELLLDIQPKETQQSGFGDMTLEFDLGRNEVVSLFLLLEKAGYIKKVSESEVLKFIEKHIKFKKGMGFKLVDDISSLLPAIKNGTGIKPHKIEEIKKRINDAQIDTTFW